jgi:hypothetical protein
MTADAVLYSWWWARRIPETCRDLEINQDNIVASRWIFLYIFVYFVVYWYPADIKKSYFHTPRSRVILEQLIVSQLVKKLPAFYTTRRFITAFTTARHMFLSRASPRYPIPLPEDPISCEFPGYCCKWTWPIQAPYIPRTEFHVPFPLLRSYQRNSSDPKHMYVYVL